MKKSIVLLVAVRSMSRAWSSADFEAVTNLWYCAQFSNVLAIAERRLSANTNDIAGLLMKASWDASFAEATAVSNSLARVISVGATIESPSFTNVFPITRIDAEGILHYMSSRTNAQKLEDWFMESKRGLNIHHIHELKALDDDGYFDAHPNPSL